MLDNLQCYHPPTPLHSPHSTFFHQALSAPSPPLLHLFSGSMYSALPRSSGSMNVNVRMGMTEEGVGVEGGCREESHLACDAQLWRAFGSVPVFHIRINWYRQIDHRCKLCFWRWHIQYFISYVIFICNKICMLGNMHLFVNESPLLSFSLIPCLKALADW